MAELQFQPSRRTRTPRQLPGSGRQTRVAFVVFGSNDASPAPSFQRLLFGVSKGADELGLNLTFHYVDPNGSADKILDSKADGLLLGGLRPSDEVAGRLTRVPSVWLMGNRQRPTWGDQVMPDNTGIGTLAAQYLLRRDHRRMGYVGLGGWSWSFGIRALAFDQTCRDAGATVHDFITHVDGTSRDYWDADFLRAAADQVRAFAALPHRPTGLFVSEDRLLAVVQRTLIECKVPIVEPTLPLDQPRPDGAVELIGCNNDARYLPLPGPTPPSIDINAEAIGRRGIEHLLWRIANRDRAERLRIMIGPTLVEPQAN